MKKIKDWKIFGTATTSSTVGLWLSVALVTGLAHYAIRDNFRQYQAKVYQSAAKVALKPNREELRPQDISDGLAYARRSTELDPDDGYGRFQYGTALYLSGRFNEASEQFRKSINAFPHSSNGVRLLASSSYSEKKFEDAAELFGRYLKANPDPAVSPDTIFRMAGVSFLRSGKLADALYFFVQATRFPEDKAEVLRLRSMLSVLLNEPWSAEYSYKAYRFTDPESEFSPMELISNAVLADKLPGAVEFLRHLNKEKPEDTSVLKALSIAQSRMGDVPGAITLMENAIKESPQDSQLYLILGDILYSNKDFRRAMEAYEHHLQLKPDSPFRKDILQKKATSRY